MLDKMDPGRGMERKMLLIPIVLIGIKASAITDKLNFYEQKLWQLPCISIKCVFASLEFPVSWSLESPCWDYTTYVWWKKKKYNFFFFHKTYVVPKNLGFPKPRCCFWCLIIINNIKGYRNSWKTKKKVLDCISSWRLVIGWKTYILCVNNPDIEKF